MLEGRFFGTMCLSEPQAGSSLADITTRAEPAGRRHLPAVRQQDVDLRRRPRADREHRPPGAGQDPRRTGRGEGHLAVHRARSSWSRDGRSASATTSCWPGSTTRWATAAPTTRCSTSARACTPRAARPAPSATWSASRTAGSTYMFHMMNEARIGVGLGAAALGYTGYLHALDYARTRTAGPPGRRRRTRPRRRCRSSSTPTSRRMLLAQKSYVEGALGAGPVLRAGWSTRSSTADDRGRPRPRAPAARRAHADREELAVAVVPGGQRPRDPGARRLRLHPRVPGRAVLPRQPAQPDPRGHPRHPGPRPARPQGRHAGRRRARAARSRRSPRRSARGRAAAELAGVRRRARRRGRPGRATSPRRCGAPATRRSTLANARSTWRRSATSWSPGCGWSSCWRPASGDGRLLRRQARGRRGTSSAASCRAPARSSTCWRASTAPRWTSTPPGSDRRRHRPSIEPPTVPATTWAGRTTSRSGRTVRWPQAG